MRRFLWFLSGATALVFLAAAGAFLYLKVFAHGFSVRSQPSGPEAFAAHVLRGMAISRDVKDMRNPVATSDEVLSEARAHWADHCAACHANNGSGDVEMGRHLYPPVPDMRQQETQWKTDGELFFIIQNGIRLTGMPAWGNGSQHDERASWSLVHFIRHLPHLSAQEEREMQSLNPKTPDELKEEQEERDFLNGEQSNEHQEHHH